MQVHFASQSFKELPKYLPFTLYNFIAFRHFEFMLYCAVLPYYSYDSRSLLNIYADGISLWSQYGIK